jgi:NADPH-dependent 2,4-dienoyl-CoA reductase/sulfur reductase-like enzyme
MSGRAVIVGAAAAGYATAEGLRQSGWQGEIVLVGEEAGKPYERPPLSKQVLAGQWEPERAALMPPIRLSRIAAEVCQTRATGLDVGGHRIRLQSGATIDYDVVVIATGVRPRALPHEPIAGVHLLRTMSDALAVRAAIGPGRRLVVIGGGFLGLEAAATARERGSAVTVVEPLADPLAARLGTHTAARLLRKHRDEQVDIRCGVGVGEFLTAPGAEDGPHINAVRTTTGEVLPADAVLVAIGCTPNVEWLAGSGLDITDGVRCDAYCNAGPDAWAAGDVARWSHLGIGQMIRLEHRQNATEQGRAVASNITTDDPRPFTPTPFFWTDHYDVKVQLAGVMPAGAIERTEEGDPCGDSFIRSFSVDGRLVGVIGWNAAKALIPYRRELDLSQPVTA